MQTYGFFNIGNSPEFAEKLFDLLAGGNQVSPESVMTIDLVRRENGVPYPLALKHCTLGQLGENVKLISKELFKHINLEN